MEKVYKILILLSSYNGEKYIAQQLESLKRQENTELTVLIRDDGSGDSTPELLKHYDFSPMKADLRCCKNIGWAESFHQLLLLAWQDYPEMDLFMFCDQDDVWLPEKCRTAADAVAREKGPALYLSNAAITDEKLNVRENINPRKEFRPDLISAPCVLLGAYPLGCTMLFNRALLDRFVKVTTEPLLSHDNWMITLAKFYGKIFYDETPHILYRQHGSNASGVLTKKKRKKIRWKDISLMGFNRKKRMLHAGMLLNAPPPCDVFQDRHAVELYLNYRKSLSRKMELFFHWKKLGFSTGSFLFDLKRRIKVILSLE